MSKNYTQVSGAFDEIVDRRSVPALKVHPVVLGEDGAHLFAAGVADMDFKIPPPVFDKLQHRLEHGVFGYETVSDKLIPSLTAWLSNRHNWEVNPMHILRAPNILNALAIAASIFTDAGDGIIVQPPVFFDFFDIIRENDREIVRNPLVLKNGRYEMDFHDLERKAAVLKTRMIYLCNPHNPIGRVWTREELNTLAEICLRHNVLVVTDEMHSDLVLPGHSYTPFASLGTAFAQNSITCISPAKTFNIASCCSAFTIIPNDERRKAFRIENSRLTVNKNNAFANVAMEAAYTQAEPWLEDAISYIKGNVDLVRSSLQQVRGVELIEPEGTFLLWLDFTALGYEPDELMMFLREKAEWAVTQGHAFGDEGVGFVRLNIACPRSRLKTALTKLASAVNH